MRDDYEAALVAIAVWLRFSAARHLTWNRNYNVKPREIGAAQVFNGLHSPLCSHATMCAWSSHACMMKKATYCIMGISRTLMAHGRICPMVTLRVPDIVAVAKRHLGCCMLMVHGVSLGCCTAVSA